MERRGGAVLTTDHLPGAPNWIDLDSPDVVAAAAFYGRVLGWEHVPRGDRGVFRAAGRTVAGVGPLPAGASSAWTVYFASPDATSVRTDPCGAVFGSGSRNELEEVTSPGALTWVELHSPDPAAASSFYRTVFGWEVVTIPGAGDFFRPAGTGPGRMFGAVVTDADPHWLPYFEVTDPDAAVATVDEVSVPPHDIDGVGRVAVLADPFGARFAVMRSHTP